MADLNDPKTHFGIRISEELRAAINQACATYGVSATHLVTKYIESNLVSEGFLVKSKEQIDG